MNITFLIGNGFDVNLGLKTRYEEFYKYLSANKGIFQYKNNIEKQIVEDINKYVGDNKEGEEPKEKLWKDFELGLGKYTENINENEVDDFIFALIGLKDKLSEYLSNETKNCIDSFEASSIQTVMRESITRFKTFLSKKAQNTLNGIEQTYGSENWDFNFLSFNYTDTLDILLNKAFPNNIMGTLLTNNNCQYVKKRLIHIHGTLDRNMILGVNDQSQIVNEKIRPKLFSKLVKPKINDDAEDLINETAGNIISQSQLFVVFGMSIGETDKKWWQLIYKRMLDSQNIYLIIIDYNKEYSERHAEHTKMLKQIIEQKFINMAGVKNDNVPKVSNRIMIQLNSGMFKINKTNISQHTENVDLTKVDETGENTNSISLTKILTGSI